MHVEWHNHDRLLVALFLASLFHAVLILGIKFEFPKPKDMPKSLDIVLVRNPAAKEPEKADFLAQENQEGGGEAKERAVPKTVPVPRVGVGEDKQPPQPVPKPTPVAKAKPKPMLKQEHSEKKAVADAGNQEHADAEQPRLSAESLSQQMADISAQISRSQQQAQAKQSRIAYINSVNAHRYKAAAYEEAWQEKVERIGTLNFPDEARRRHLSGSLLLAVGIKPDGSVYSIQVRKPSGEPVLDDAAKQIVQLAAPFAPFPEELKKDYDVLVITRTWRFTFDSRVETGGGP